MPPEPPPQQPADEIHQARELLNRHLQFIESQCRRAMRRMASGMGTAPGLDLENDSLELFNLVLDRIQTNDFAFIRRFDQRARFTTYLTTLISRQAVEMVRRRRGRSRARQRAESLGQLGIRLFEKIFSQGLRVPEALREMLRENQPAASEQRLAQMAEHIVGRGGMSPIIISMGDLPEPADTFASSPETLFLERERNERILAAVSLLHRNLTGTEKILLRLRFPPDPQSPPGKAAEIASLLGLSRKAVYRRLDRLLPHCRALLQQAGIQFNDLFPGPEKGNSSAEARPSKGRTMP